MNAFKPETRSDKLLIRAQQAEDKNVKYRRALKEIVATYKVNPSLGIAEEMMRMARWHLENIKE